MTPSGSDWMKQFIRKLLDIAHGRWLYQNFSLHNTHTCYLHLQKEEGVLEAMTKLAECDPREIPDESRFLLEINPTISDAPLCQKEYWVAAMQAALTAGRRRGRPHVTTRPCITSQQDSTTKSQRLHLYRIRRRSTTLLHKIREELDLHPNSGRQKSGTRDSSGRTSGSNKRLRKPD